MPQENKVPSLLIEGLNAISKLEKAIAKQGINFSFDRLDEADEMRQCIQVVRNELSQYNQLLRQVQARQNQQNQQPVPVPSEEPKMEVVSESEEEGE